MRSSIKLFIFYVIVSLFLVLCWSKVLINSNGSSKDYRILRVYKEQTIDVTPINVLNDYSVLFGCNGCTRYSNFVENNEEPKPFEVADPLYGEELYIFYIGQIVEQYYPEMDPYIALSVLETESNYLPNLTSSAGAIGLMQVIPKYHFWRIERYGLNDLWDPYTNIICGIDFLDELYRTYGSWERGLLGYNNRPSYVKHVIRNADILRGGNYFGNQASADSGSS